MNIFALSQSPVEAAIWQHDKHVVKMTLETAQLLSTAIWTRDDWHDRCSPKPLDSKTGKSWLYRPTHINHPSTKWTRESVGNFQWLALHGRALAHEYSHRFNGAVHKSYTDIIKPLLYMVACGILGDDEPMTPFAVAMPDKYKVDGDPVQSYRNYYVAEKLASNPKWTNRCRVADLPSWLSEPVLHPDTHS